MDMKRYINLIGLLFCLLVWNACVDEDVVKKQKEVIDGIPTTVSLSFATEDADKVSTRSALPTSEEYRVYDLLVVVFKQEISTDVHTSTGSKDDEGRGETTGILSLDLTSGKKRIYAIANVKENPLMPVTGIDDIQTSDDLSLEQFLNFTAILNSPTVERGQSHLLMSGVYEVTGGDGNVQNDNGEVTIDASDNGKTLSGEIILKHVDSKITFSVTAGGDNITFTPKEWKVFNVPLKSYVFEKEWSASSTTHDAVGYAVEEDYFNSELTNFNTAAEGGITKGGSFTFYMPENRKNVQGDIKGDAEELNIDPYQLREKQIKDANGKNGAYKYAPQYATYVEMTGSFHQDASKNDVEKSAEVKYTIHLGYEKKNAENFRSRRGCDYIYNVRVTGVNSIEVEVETSDQEEPTENQPGAEGDVVKSKTYLYVDAHYDTKTITFNRGNISKSASYRVKTPYSDVGDDYKWVEFVQNGRTNSQVGYDTYNFYYDKGEHDYSRGRVYLSTDVEKLEQYTHNKTNGYISKSGLDPEYGFFGGTYGKRYYKKMQIKISSEGSSNSFKYNSDFIAYPQDQSKRLDIEQLIAILKYEIFKDTDEAKDYPLPNGIVAGVNYQSPLFNNDGDATFTVFINEFYYPEKSKDWKEFVNVPNREMHILCDTKYSKDQESSLTTSNFLISQRSIKTFYDPDNSVTAWGVETIREGDRLPAGGAFGSDKTNGRSNMLGYMSSMIGEEWSNYMDLSKNEMKSDYYNDYKKAEYACLQRNRDLDGNGKIEKKEIKWYLPAINQMTGMWIGRDGFSSMEVYLFNEDTKKIMTDNDRRQYHFMSSNYIMFWAEEGAAIGNYEIEKQNGLDYRCVRNLGFKEETDDNIPLDYVQYKDHVFDLSRMNSKAIRTEFYTTELAVTDELNQANRPYKYFQVAKGQTSDAITQEEIYKGESPCKVYSEKNDKTDVGSWRMPNHRELCLIHACGAYSSDESFSRTRSSLGKKITTFGSVFYQQYEGQIELNEKIKDKALRVRCVKDLKTAVKQ